MSTVRLVASRLKRDGLSEVAKHALRKAARRTLEHIVATEPELPLRTEDIVDPASLGHTAKPRRTSGTLNVGWVCTPPGPGSGGHTTFFRMVQAMEARGHRCTLYLYDRNDDDVSRHEHVIRRHWPEMAATVRSATTGMEGLDAIVASSWSTAHVIAARSAHDIRRFYFIQDYEPYFHPRGTLYAMAEDSYRLGFTHIALGEMIGGVLKAELGQEPAATVPFACDTDVYHLIRPQDGTATRQGVVYYAKKAVDRRGYMLAKLALEQFHALRPEQEIHVYGDRVSGWNIPITNHGNLAPRELNELYNRTIAGLAISFTNISLVPGELLAAGNVPVLNESAFSAQVLKDPDVVWSPASPSAIAGALAGAVSASDVDGRAGRIAQRPRVDWATSQAEFAAFMEAACSGSENHWGLP